MNVFPKVSFFAVKQLFSIRPSMFRTFSGKCQDVGVPTSMYQQYLRSVQYLCNPSAEILPKDALEVLGRKKAQAQQDLFYESLIKTPGGQRGLAHDLLMDLQSDCAEVLESVKDKERTVIADKRAKPISGSFQELGYTVEELAQLILNTLIKVSFIREDGYVSVGDFHNTLRSSLRYPVDGSGKSPGESFVKLDSRLFRKLYKTSVSKMLEKDTSKKFFATLSMQPLVTQGEELYRPFAAYKAKVKHLCFYHGDTMVRLHEMFVPRFEPSLVRPNAWKVDGESGQAFQRSAGTGNVRNESLVLNSGRHDHNITFQAKSKQLATLNQAQREPVVFSSAISKRLFEAILDKGWCIIAHAVDDCNMSPKVFREKGYPAIFDKLEGSGFGFPGSEEQLSRLVELRYGAKKKTPAAKKRIAAKLRSDFNRTVKMLSWVKFHNDNPIYLQMRLDFRSRLYYMGFISVTASKFLRLVAYKVESPRVQLSSEGLKYLLKYLNKHLPAGVKPFPEDTATTGRLLGLLEEMYETPGFRAGSLESAIIFLQVEVCLKHDIPLTIQLDATASAVQILSVMLGNPKLIALCNLQAGKEPVDPYTQLVKLADFTRKDVKQVLMTTVYGSQINAQVQKLIKAGVDPKKAKKIIQHMRRVLAKTPLNKVVEAVRITTRGKDELNWNNGLGARSTICYLKSCEQQCTFETPSGESPASACDLRVRFKTRSTKADRRKQNRAVMANYCHFMDATVLWHAISLLRMQKIRVLTIHDAFIVHPNHQADVVRSYNKGLRRAQLMVAENVGVGKPLTKRTLKRLLDSEFSLQG